MASDFREKMGVTRGEALIFQANFNRAVDAKKLKSGDLEYVARLYSEELNRQERVGGSASDRNADRAWGKVMDAWDAKRPGLDSVAKALSDIEGILHAVRSEVEELRGKIK